MKQFTAFTAALALLLLLSGCGAAGSHSLTLLPIENTPLAALPGQTQPISAEQAQQIALDHAALTQEEVIGLRAEFDRDDNRWDVDFRAGNWEYEYDIHAQTGAIAKVDKEYDPAKTPAPQTTQPPTSVRLTAEEVRAIALQHAGIAEDQIRFLRVEFDFDDGVPRYEVEFVSNGREYEYDIHAETGAILSFDKDR